jgi:type IV pilus assembly protein PilQ
VDLAVGNLPLGDLLRNVARAGGVSIGYRGDSALTVNCNLSRARIDELLLFLCRQYDLDVEVTGNIVSVYPYVPPPPRPEVRFDPADSTLGYTLDRTPLAEFARLLADACGVNAVVPPPLEQKRVSGYAVRLPIAEALRALAAGNELTAVPGGEKLWYFDPAPAPPEGTVAFSTRRQAVNGEQLTVDSLGRISVQIEQAGLYDVLCTLCERMGLNYYFISPVEGQCTLFLKEVELHTLLKVLLTGTPYSYYEEEGIYMFGASDQQALASVRVVPLESRTLNKLVEAIPPELREGVQIQPFGELNSLILSGDQRKVARVEQFVRAVDKTIPLVTIEVLIVDATRDRKNEQGVSLGVGSEPRATTGSLLGEGLNLELGAKAINSLIDGFNGFGAINLGKVNANFYANLKMMESNGDIRLESTPKLSTLNGHEASLTNGERRYYKEVQETLMGSQNPVQTSSYQWKSIDANLELKIVPAVSGNGEITLAVEISQTEFSQPPKDDETPLGTSTRSFQSEIRVRNEEMVLLGGIERNERNKSASGLPFAARVPVLKWLFGQSVDNDLTHKLNIFIKPTVIY